MISPNGIRAVLFDLDGTLRHNRPASNQVFFDHAITLGLKDSPEGERRALRWAHYYWADSEELRADVQRLGDKQEPFWLNYTHRQLLAFGCSIEEAEALSPAVYQHMTEQYQPGDWIPADVPATLQTLKNAGFHLGIVSNRDTPFQDYLDEVGLQPLVDFSLAAGEANSWKPDVGIFHEALRKASSLPEQTVYLGDNYFADILGARQAGIHPILIDPEKVFPEADCPVIRTVGELVPLLEAA